jgi:hypothetical protein
MIGLLCLFLALVASPFKSKILTTKAEIEQWMTARIDDALKLQRPLADGKLKIVAKGERKDAA